MSLLEIHGWASLNTLSMAWPIACAAAWLDLPDQLRKIVILS